MKPCARCHKHPRFNTQAYCRSCGLQVNAEWRAANRPMKDGRPPEHNTGRNLRTPEQKRLDKNRRAIAYRMANKEKVRMWNRLRRHRERAAGTMPDRWDIGWLVCSQDAKCVYCKTPFHSAAYELDHKTPISRGGSNDLENIQLVCATCNMRKGAKTHQEFGLLIWTMEDLAKS